MTSVSRALHVATVAGKDVRFFASPSSDPDCPWHVADDLYLALNIPRAVRKDFRQRLKAQWRAEVRTVASDTGIVTIAPHFMAQGVIGAAEEIGCAPYEVAIEYPQAMSMATGLLMRSLGLSVQEEVAYLVAAFRAGGGD